jgi:DNA-binding Lrp family transcriptional regulator
VRLVSSPNGDSADKSLHHVRLDDIDDGLIKALREDGRMALGELGRRVGLSGDAVRERLRRLREAGIVRIAGRVDPAALGYGTLALVLLKVHGNSEQFAERLSRVEEIDLVGTIAGGSDLAVEFICRDDTHLTQLLDEHIRSHDDVREVSVFVYLEVLKDSTGADLMDSAPASERHFDDADRAVLEALQHDGRASYQDVAARTGLSYANARRRTRALIESRAVRIETMVNRLTEGHLVAAIGVRMDGPLAPIREALNALDEVEFAVVTTGPFDLLLDVACPDRARLVELVFDSLRETPGVSGTETFIYTQMLKLPLWWFGLVRRTHASIAARQSA